MIQVIDKSIRILKIKASAIPNLRAFLRISLGSLFVKMLINMMLSTPRTTSKKVRVKKARASSTEQKY